MERLARIVPRGDLGITCDASVTSDGNALVAVASSNPGGISLDIDGEARLQLQIDYTLMMSPNSKQATVLTSNFIVRPSGVPRPLFTVDYVRKSRRNIPSAHYNFHFHQDEIIFQLVKAGNARRGKVHRQSVAKGQTPRLADLHFPVGGHRFRPCLEDVLELLWVEFGIDVLQSATIAIREGRREWRRKQLRAAVSDDPAAAIEELRSKGYTVEWHGEGKESGSRRDRVEAI